MQRKDDGYFSSTPPPLEQERGSLLTVWLIFFTLMNGYVAYSNVRQGMWLSALWAAFGVVSGIGTWLWFKVAFYGMLIGFLYNIAVALDAQSVNDVMYGLVFLGLTYFLVQQKMEYFR
jgi:hypothetical protein